MKNMSNTNRFLSILGLSTALYALSPSLYAMEQEDFNPSSPLQKKITKDESAEQKVPSLFNVEKFHEYYHLALNNDTKAQYNMGIFYKNGYGIKQDYQEAMKWFRKAAQQNHLGAHNQIGLLYTRGQGVKLNNEKAMKWFLKAQDDAEARCNIGLLYLNGEGICIETGYENRNKYALYWFLSAAEQDHAFSQFFAGLLYDVGDGGVKQDYQEAMKWYLKAAQQNHSRAQLAIGNLYCLGKGVSKNYYEAKKWYCLAAQQGNIHAKTLLSHVEILLQPSPPPCIIQ